MRLDAPPRRFKTRREKQKSCGIGLALRLRLSWPAFVWPVRFNHADGPARSIRPFWPPTIAGDVMVELISMSACDGQSVKGFRDPRSSNPRQRNEFGWWAMPALREFAFLIAANPPGFKDFLVWRLK
jgi:hypothetical protein